MSREVKIGILTLVVFIVLIWGYNFLKGQNLFDNNKVYHVKYENVEQLEVASPVLVNGYKVGKVTKIKIDPNDYSVVIVDIDIKGAINVPVGTMATIINLGLVGGKAIVLEINRDCKGGDCVKSGDYLKGGMRGMLSSMLPPSDLDAYMEKIQNGLKGVSDSLSGGSESEIVGDAKSIIKNLSAITDKLDKMLNKTDKNIEVSIANVAAITASLKNSDSKIESILNDLSEMTKSLKNANIDSLIIKSDDAVQVLTKSVDGLSGILEKADKSFDSFDMIMADVNKGKGSLGKLLKDEKLYNELNLTIKHTNLLLQDLRLYPGRYFNISLLKGKPGKYKKVEEDPGLVE